MGHLSYFASKLNNAIKLLDDFDGALRYFRQKIGDNLHNNRESEQISKILKIISPISRVLEGNLSKSTELNEMDIIDTLKSVSDEKWEEIRNSIFKINNKFTQQRFRLKENDIIILNDVGDAFELECNKLFYKMKQSR